MHDLFALDALPGIQGLRHEDGFLSAEEEEHLVAVIGELALAPAQYKGYTARRRVVSFGGSYDFDTNRLSAAADLPASLEPLRARVAQWLGLAPRQLVHALVAEYAPGTPLGWHRDVPDFELIAGVSLGTPATLRFRRYPPSPSTNRQVLRLDAAPRSIYAMQGEARWGWQHDVVPTRGLRWSITFRTARVPREPAFHTHSAHTGSRVSP